MIYAALLRGINVGGNNKVNMQELKEAFESLGMGSVATYINSGNILFTDERHTKKEIMNLLEELILARFSLSIKVLVLSFPDFKRVMEKLPDYWRNDKDMKSDVFFLWDDLNFEKLNSALMVIEGIDHMIHVPGAVLWSVDKKLLAKSGLMKLAGSPVYKKMTIRNVNTVRRLYEMMSAMEEIHAYGSR